MADTAADRDAYLQCFMAAHAAVLKMRNSLRDKCDEFEKEMIIGERVAQIERLLVNLDKDL